jgi:signal transduction histidine kinase
MPASHASPPFLSRAAQLLASSLGFDDVLRHAVRAALPELGDFGFFDVIDGGSVRRICAAHEADDIEALLAQTHWVREPHPELDLSALSSGEAALHPAIDDAWYRRFAANADQLALLRRLAFRSMLTVPVRFQDELLGALTLFMGRSGRRHERAHLADTQDLAALVAAAVARVRLLGAEREARAQAERARRRLEVLAEASGQLSDSLEPRATLDRIAAILVPAIADWCRIDLVAADGSLERAVAHHVDPAQARHGLATVRRLRAADDTPGSMAWCVRTGLSHRVVVREPDEFAAMGDPDLLAFAQAIGMRAFLVTPLKARGRTLGALAVLQAESGRGLGDDDAALVTELAQRAALALDNARLYSEAEAARREAERANRAKDEFLAMLGHELRNPLAPIVTNLRLMAMKPEPGLARERGVIERQVASLATLVDDLLDVARIARGDVQLRRERIDLGDVLAKASEIAGPLMEQRRHALARHLPDGAMPLPGDAARLTQVFANLLTNAARYTPEGGQVVLSAARESNGWRVSVTDDGQGIEAELLGRVFELFVQGRQGLDRAAGGLGVGLAVVKNLVTLHGGTVSAHSAGPGLGSEFVVRLPAGDEAGLPAPAHTQPEAEAAPADARARRILVVDDNRDAAEALATLLELEGHEARISLDPMDALALAEQFRPEVAILDIGLPRLDGHTLGKRLRDQPGLAQLRLVALTGYGLPDDRARSLEAGFAAHLVKPVDPDTLLDTLRRLT